MAELSDFGRGVVEVLNIWDKKEVWPEKKNLILGNSWQNSHQRVDEKKNNLSLITGGSALNYCDRQTPR